MKIMIVKTIVEGLGLGFFLILVCAFGIRKGAVNMVHLYSKEVQKRCVELSLTTEKVIRQKSLMFKVFCIPGYVAYVLISVYLINGANSFWTAFWQSAVILAIMNCMDRFLIDGVWVEHTKAWIIPGTEDLMPYIKEEDRKRKWLAGTVGMTGIAALLSAVMMLMIH